MPNVLIVDDEKSIRLTLSTFLEHAGHTPYTTATADEARAALEAHDIDVAIIDILLGRDNGIRLAAELRERVPNIQIIIATGEPEVQSARDAIRLHVFDYLAKPVSKEEIIDVVRRAAKEKSRRDEYLHLQRQQEEYQRGLERRVEHTEEQYRNLVEGLSDIVFSLSNDGTITYVNPAVETLLGYKPEEMLQRDFAPYIHPDDLSLVRKTIQDHLAGTTYPLEYRLQTREGHFVWVRSTARPIRSDDGQVVGLRGLASDITERKLAERELQRSSREWEQTFNAVPDIITILNREHQIVRANRAAIRALGSDMESVFGKRCYEVFHGTKEPPPDCPHTALLEDGREHQLEMQPGALPGTYLVSASPLRDATGHVWGCVHVARDITQRRKLEKEIETHRRHLRAMIDASLEPIVLLQTDATIIECNTAAALRADKKRAQLIGSSAIDAGLLPATNTINLIQTLVQEGVPRHVTDRSGEHVINRIFWPVFDMEGSVAQVAVYETDVTEQKRMEAHISETQRMEALGQLCAGVSHEYNNILMGIIGYAHHLQKRLPGDDDALVFAERIGTLSRQAVTVSRKLLDFARPQTPHREFVALDSLVGESVETLGHIVEEDVEITAELESRAQVLIDRHRFQEILMNVVLNARDALPNGGTIHMTTAVVEPGDPRALRAGTDSAHRYAMLSIRDNGEGMDQETLDRARTPFFTTKPPGRGTGLGLSSAENIVNAHDGRLEIQSVLGEGSTVTIWVPMQEESNEADGTPK